MKKTTLRAGSHIPVLNRLLDHTKNPVVELGTGWNSTPMLHWLTKERGMLLFSFESDYDWLKNFLEFETDHHQLHHHDFMTDIKVDFPLGIVFVDHRPARKRRSSAKFFADKADFIVLHDSELADDPAYKYTPIYDNFKYKYEYRAVGEPYTMVLSNKIDPKEILR